MTFPEHRLWFFLRDKLSKYKFRRQHGIGIYIVDFYCPKFKLAIEVDGETHGETKQKIYDEKRTKDLKKLGIKILRFTNPEIMTNIENVLEVIHTTIYSSLPPPTHPLTKGEESN